MAKFDDYKFNWSADEVESSEKKVPIIGLDKPSGPNIKFNHIDEIEDVNDNISTEKNHSVAKKFHHNPERPENSKEPTLGGDLSRKLQTPVPKNEKIQIPSKNETSPLILGPTEPEQLEETEDSLPNTRNSWMLHPVEPDSPEKIDEPSSSGDYPWSLHSEQPDNLEEPPRNSTNSWTLHPTEPEQSEVIEDLSPSGNHPWGLHSPRPEKLDEPPLDVTDSWTIEPTEPELSEVIEEPPSSTEQPWTIHTVTPEQSDEFVDSPPSGEQTLALHKAIPEPLTNTNSRKSRLVLDKLDKFEQLTTGQQLANARKSLNLTVKDVAEFFHLPVTTIEAIENSEYEKLYGVAYATGHVRAYANYLNLDADRLIENDPVLGVIPVLELGDLDLSQTTERKRRPFGFRTMLVRLVVIALITGAAIAGWQQRDGLSSLVNGLLNSSEATTTIETPTSNPDSSETNTNLIHSDRLS